MWKGAADRWGMAAAFPPEALPLRPATRRRPPQRPYGTPRSNVGHKLSVRKRTCFAHAWCARSPAYSLAKSRGHASSQTPAHATLFPCGSSFLHTIATPSSYTTASCGSLPEQLPPITLEISFTTDASSYSSHATQQSCTQRRGDYQLRSKSCAQ